MSRAVLALGANLGDREAAIRAAVEALAAAGTVLRVSSLHETAPVGGPEQPDYLNAVLLLETDLDPGALLDVCHDVENRLGRVRAERWGPRTIDIDVVAYDDLVSDDPRLTLPHPRAHERPFVLLPWLEVDPDATLPDGRSVAELAEAAPVKPTRIVTLLGVAALSLVVAYLTSLVAYRWLPPLPRSSFATFVVLAAAEAAYASSITARRAGKPHTKPIMPIVVARAAALAKASSLMAAIGCGVWAALLAFTSLHRDDYSSAGRDATTSATALVSSVLLVAAALYLERACRVKEPPTGATGDPLAPMEEL